MKSFIEVINQHFHVCSNNCTYLFKKKERNISRISFGWNVDK